MENTGNKIRVVVIGLGGMGMRWAEVVRANEGSALLGVADTDGKKAAVISEKFGCRTYADWREAVGDSEVDAIVVATPHVFLTQIAQAALKSGKHVFCEKPGGVSSAEIKKGVDIAQEKNLRYRVNFNMRLHPAVALAKHKIDSGEIGDLMFMRGVYAHGGREGYEKEWWCKKELSGGGELIDQGSHLIDLAHWFLGPFSKTSAALQTAFWNIAPLEDNAFILLQNEQGTVASLHASWTQWKKMFRIELYGSEGYLICEGLGGQYGPEKLIEGRRVLGREAPPERVFEFPSEAGKPDTALKNSWKEFLQSIRENRNIGPTAHDAVLALGSIEAARERA